MHVDWIAAFYLSIYLELVDVDEREEAFGTLVPCLPSERDG